MMINLFYLFLVTSLFANELEVDGGLVVTESVTASSFIGDGSGLTNLVSLGTQKPEKIFSYMPTSAFNITVPSNKVWNVSIMFYESSINLNGKEISSAIAYGNNAGYGSLWLTPGNSISCTYLNEEKFVHLSILEYSTSSSGIDQGMDYVEP